MIEKKIQIALLIICLAAIVVMSVFLALNQLLLLGVICGIIIIGSLGGIYLVEWLKKNI